MKRWLHPLLLAALTQASAQSPMELPVYLEESHAGSFYILASTLPLDEPHTLILVDAHTDASGVAGSDAVRTAIRRGPTREEQAKLFAQWRERGRIQCYDWIEPLMPAPVEEVFWLSAPLLPEAQRADLERTAREQLDAHHEALPRDCGLLAGKYHATDLRGLKQKVASWSEDRAVIASVDLDYFASMAPENLESAMDQVLDPILALPGLRALTFCISSPWQRSPEQAERLVFLAFDAVLRVPRARLRFEPFASCGPDKSLRTREITARGEKVPAFDVAGCGLALRWLLAAHWRPEMTLTRRPEMETLVHEWRADPFLARITVPGQLTAPDGDWHFDAAELDKLALRVEPEPVGATVKWQAIVPSGARCRMMDGPWTYAAGAPRWLRWKCQGLGGGAELPLAKLRPVLDSGRACGTVKVRASVLRDGEERLTAPVTVRIRAAGAHGFRAALSEQFRLPYLFGSTFLTAEDEDGVRRSGAECLEGSDCANFLAAALRADGWRAPWGSAADLRRFLRRLPDNVRPTPAAVDRGLILDFGAHAAALWEDRPPRGELDDGDLCAHHLEDFPCILPLGELREGRGAPTLYRIDPAAENSARAVFGGDVMLARTVGERLRNGEPVLEALRPRFAGACGIVNLECAIPHRAPAAGFSAPAEALTALRESGIRAVSLANNHSNDAGDTGLSETAAALASAGIVPFGHSPDPVRLELNGAEPLTLFGWHEFGGVPAEVLAAKIPAAKNAVVFAHWGREHDRQPSSAQRAAAEVFVKAGATLVIGAGPHAVQPLEWIARTPVAWSLGNLVFDDRGPDAEWRRGALLEVRFSATGSIVRCRLIEVPVLGGP
jgi:Bacterial capsule synthesis protein PGA_cap